MFNIGNLLSCGRTVDASATATVPQYGTIWTIVPTTIHEGETTPPLSSLIGVNPAVGTQEIQRGTVDGGRGGFSPVRSRLGTGGEDATLARRGGRGRGGRGGTGRGRARAASSRGRGRGL